MLQFGGVLLETFNDAPRSSFAMSILPLQNDFNYDDLDKMNFDFSVSEGQSAGSNNEVGTVVGKYAYFINPKTENTTLWKLKDIQ